MNTVQGPHFFGLHSDHLTRRADTIAHRHGARHINIIDASGEKRGWFECPRSWNPTFPEATAKAVLLDIEKIGGLEALKKR